jgi:hypothetical protein
MNNARFGEPSSAGRGAGARRWPVPPELVSVAIVSCVLQPDRVGAYVTDFSPGGAIRFLSDPTRKRDAALLAMTSGWGIEGLVVTSVQLTEIRQAHKQMHTQIGVVEDDVTSWRLDEKPTVSGHRSA